MANWNGREALRGSEVETLDLITDVISPEHWEELLKALLERAVAQGNRGLGQKLVRAGAASKYCQADHTMIGQEVLKAPAGAARPYTMENWNGRETLRGAEVETLDLIAEVVSSGRWAGLLNAPLERAVAHGSRGLAQKLVRAGAEIGAAALHEAVLGGHGEIVGDLLDIGASLVAKDTEGNNPLHVAVEAGDEEMLQLLLLRGVDKDAMKDYKDTPLFLATRYNNVAAALILLVAGADANVRCGSDKRSAVHAAARMGYVDILRAAIEHGGDVNACSGVCTPLYLAARGNHVEAIDVLVEAGASIEGGRSKLDPPLHAAADNLNVEAVQALLKHGADVNARNGVGITPIFLTALFAPRLGALETADLLLRSGADETVTSPGGTTAADVIGNWFGFDGEGAPLLEDIERMRRLLENAPADRAWRRRGYLVLCRARPDRVRQGQESCSGHVGVAQRAQRGAGSARAEGGGGGEGTKGGGEVAGDETDGDWAGAVAGVLGVQEEGIFRAIVGCL